MVVGVEHVHVWVSGEVRIERHTEQSAIPEVVDVDVQVGEDVGRRVAQGVEDLDDAALLSDEDPTIAAETDNRWVGQAVESNRLLEPGGQGRGVCHARRRYGNGRANHQHQKAHKKSVKPTPWPSEPYRRA